jgi:type III secretion protein J
MTGGRRVTMLLAACALAALSACSREVASGLDETDANHGIVALARVGIEAEKIPDTAVEGRFRLVVQRDDATSAIAVLSSEELPRMHAPPSVEPSFVASPESDRAARTAATAAQVERTLSSIDGVLDARVLLDIPAIDPLTAALVPASDAAAAPHSTAAVLLRHRGANPPLSEGDLRRLVAGAVSGLAVDHVAVVLIAVPAPVLAGDRSVAYLGPVGVARGSLATAKAIAAAMLVVIAGLAGVILALAMRLRRQKDRETEPLAAPAAKAR